MNYLASFFIFVLCFAGMAIGLLLTKKVLKKGCALGPDCACQKEPDPKAEKADCKHQPD